MATLTLAWRSLWRRPRRTAISLISVAFGLALAIVFGSLANGLYRKSVEDATQMMAGPLTVEAPAYRDDPAPEHAVPSIAAIRRALAPVPGIARLKPLVSAQVMVSTATGSAGVSMLGVVPAIDRETSPLSKKIVTGRYLEEDDARGAVVGATLAKRLHLVPGNKLVVTATDVHGQMATDLLRVTGIFQTGADEVDAFFVEVPIAVCQKLLGLGPDRATQVGILVDARDESRLAEIERAASSAVPPGLAVYSWQQTMPSVAGWIALDGRVNRILRSAVVALVLFTILNTLLMSVLERGREFAVLLALGTPPARLRAQVFLETVLLAGLGCLLGAAAGVAGSLYGAIHGVDLRAIEGETTITAGGFAVDPFIHFDLRASTVLLITTLVFLATVAMGLWPTWRATKVDLATTLRTAR